MKISPATEAWELWRHRQSRRRRTLAWSCAGAAFLAVFVLAAVVGLFHKLEVGEKGESIAVKLGNPVGEDLPLQVAALPDPAMQAVLAAQKASALTAVEETRPSVPEPGAVPVAPPKLPKPALEKPKTDKVPKPVATPLKASSTPVPQALKADQPVVTEKVIRGVEKGNASELVLKPQGDKISQNAYWPVYLFMPLPAKLDAGILGRIQSTQLYSAEDLRSLLLQSYTKGADGLSLTEDPGIAVRPALWQILEGAGYDVTNADYKKGRNLQPVVISFKLGLPPGDGGNPPILEIHLDQSSGSGPVDDAVLYAFQRSTFANGTGQVAQGRYSYDFNGRK